MYSSWKSKFTCWHRNFPQIGNKFDPVYVSLSFLIPGKSWMLHKGNFVFSAASHRLSASTSSSLYLHLVYILHSSIRQSGLRSSSSTRKRSLSYGATSSVDWVTWPLMTANFITLKNFLSKTKHFSFGLSFSLFLTEPSWFLLVGYENCFVQWMQLHCWGLISLAHLLHLTVTIIRQRSDSQENYLNNINIIVNFL